MAKKQDNIEPRDEAHAQAMRFGQMIRQRREALKLRQDDLVFSTGLGRRFIIELEAGKSSCQLGKALIVANALGLRPFDIMQHHTNESNALLPDLVDFPTITEDKNGQP